MQYRAFLESQRKVIGVGKDDGRGDKVGVEEVYKGGIYY